MSQHTGLCPASRWLALYQILRPEPKNCGQVVKEDPLPADLWVGYLPSIEAQE